MKYLVRKQDIGKVFENPNDFKIQFDNDIYHIRKGIVFPLTNFEFYVINYQTWINEVILKRNPDHSLEVIHSVENYPILEVFEV